VPKSEWTVIRSVDGNSHARTASGPPPRPRARYRSRGAALSPRRLAPNSFVQPHSRLPTNELRDQLRSSVPQLGGPQAEPFIAGGFGSLHGFDVGNASYRTTGSTANKNERAFIARNVHA